MRPQLLPTAFGNLLDPCLPDLFTTNYRPMAGVIMMASMFTLFVIEMWLNSKMGGHSHSHGGPMGLDSASATRGMTPPPRPPRPDSFDEVQFEKKMAHMM